MKNKILTLVLLLASSFAVLISCQNKSNSSNSVVAQPAAYYNPNTVAGCTSCNFAQSQLAQVVSEGTTSFPVTLNAQILGDQLRMQQSLATGYNPQKLYSGPIAITGTLTVGNSGYNYMGYSGIQATSCQLPAGQYSLYTRQPGNMNAGSFEIPQLEAVIGATRIIFAISSGVVIDNNGDGTVDRIAGQLIPMYQTNGAAQVSCNDPGVFIQ